MDAPLPTPRLDDDEDVHWALSTAGALWARDERVEALKWLRRAAEQASDVNADIRALELFKAAAEVANKVGPLSAPPPPPKPSAPPVQPPASPPRSRRRPGPSRPRPGGQGLPPAPRSAPDAASSAASLRSQSGRRGARQAASAAASPSRSVYPPRAAHRAGRPPSPRRLPLVPAACIPPHR